MVDHPSVAYLRRLFGETTEGPIFLCSLPNDRSKGNGGVKTRHCVGKDCAQQIYSFVNHHDQIGRGTYYTMSTVKEGLQRCKENCLETPALVIDLDFKSVEAAPAHCENLVPALFCPPTGIIRSGFGLHVVWQLRESLPTQENMDRLEAVLRQLADVIGGDLAVCHPAALLRLPGSHNSKKGDRREVVVASWGGRLYEIDDLEDWLSIQSPVIKRKLPISNETPQLNGEVDNNAYLAFAKSLGFELPLDAAQRLAQMTYQGPGESGVYATQCAVTMSLCQKEGWTVDKIVSWVIDETRRAAGADGANWNWVREERRVRKLTEDGIKIVEKERAFKREIQERELRSEAVANEQLGEEQKAFVQGNIVDLQQAKTKREAKVKAVAQQDKPDIATVVAESIIRKIREDGRDILLTEGEVWIYDGGGCWHIMTGAEKQWITTMIHECFEALKIPRKTNSLTLAWRCITENPRLYKEHVSWQRPGLVVCQNGVFDLDQWRLLPHSPSHYALRKCGAAFVENADCPKFLALLRSMFSDRSSEEVDEVVVLLEEWFGAALAIGLLSRESRKACFVHGHSRTGKTELSSVLRLLIGDPIASFSMFEFASDKFALQQLVGANGWIRDDAFNEGDKMDPQKFKTIVTGEPIDVRRMGVLALTGVRFEVPVMLNGNNLPFARDTSDAIYNRSIVIPLNVIRSEEEAASVRREMGAKDGETIGACIWKEEASGILLWALQGLVDLRDRGHFVIPEWIKGQIGAFKDTNNPVAEWARTHIIFDPDIMVHRSDLACCYHGWQFDAEGSEAKPLGARKFIPALRAAIPGCGDFDSHGRRYITGIKLTQEGLNAWHMQKTNDCGLRGSSKGYSGTKEEVNRRNKKEQ